MVFLRAAVVTLVALSIMTGAFIAQTGDESTTTVPKSPTSTKAAPSTPTVATTDKVDMKDTLFAPAVIRVEPGTEVTWTNRDPIGHTVTPADPAAWGDAGSGSDAAQWLMEGGTYAHTFAAPGVYVYYCVPHAAKASDGSYRGMVGKVYVGVDPDAADVVPVEMPTTTVVPSPVAAARILPDDDGIVRIHLETKEVVAQMADGVAYRFWTFGGTVPGPMLRVREGDMVELTLHNADDSTMPHSIDLHAVTGPGGGAKATQTAPGETTSFRFQALNPGIYIYHCATSHIPSHIANGMYGMILVEPKEGLPAVDREYYVVQGETYPTGKLAEKGIFSLSLDKLLDEQPEYFLLNGKVGALTGDGALTAEVGETVRIYVGVGAFVPSNFHVIGEIFDTVYPEGSFASPHKDVQTTIVPAGGAAAVEFKVEVPGTYLLVDHVLTHAIDRGAAGVLVVSGEEDPEVFEPLQTGGADAGH